MKDVRLIQKYFDLIPQQTQQFAQLFPLYKDWNSKINVISRKNIDKLYINHVLHSLGIAKVVKFLPQADILDVGTGGGFPGIPLAILFPEANFHLVDSIGKKLKVVLNNAYYLLLDMEKAETGVHKNTVYRKLNRNASKRTYQAEKAQMYANERKERFCSNRKFTNKMKKIDC